jgi:RNA polymerase sigma-70 factor (ECF subfamily)
MPANMPDDNEQMELLRIAIRQLNDTDKAIIALYLEELSYQEIATITGITENNVGVKINRIKNKLQQLLQIKK